MTDGQSLALSAAIAAFVFGLWLATAWYTKDID